MSSESLNDDYEFRIVSSTLSPLTNEESLNLLSIIQPYLNISKMKNSYKKTFNKNFSCSFNIQSNFELQRAIYSQYDIIHISKNCHALHYYFTSPKYTFEKICFYIFRCSISFLSAYLINRQFNKLFPSKGIEKLEQPDFPSSDKNDIGSSSSHTFNFINTRLSNPNSSLISLKNPGYTYLTREILYNKSYHLKDLMLKFIPFYLSYKLTTFSKFGFFIWNNYPVNYVPVVIDSNENEKIESKETYSLTEINNKELFLINKQTLAKEMGFWSAIKRLFS